MPKPGKWRASSPPPRMGRPAAGRSITRARWRLHPDRDPRPLLRDQLELEFHVGEADAVPVPQVAALDPLSVEVSPVLRPVIHHRDPMAAPRLLDAVDPGVARGVLRAVDHDLCWRPCPHLDAPRGDEVL